MASRYWLRASKQRSFTRHAKSTTPSGRVCRNADAGAVHHLGLQPGHHQVRRRRHLAGDAGGAALGHRRPATAGLGAGARHPPVQPRRHPGRRPAGGFPVRRRIRLHPRRAQVHHGLADDRVHLPGALLHRARTGLAQHGRAPAGAAVGRHRAGVCRHPDGFRRGLFFRRRRHRAGRCLRHPGSPAVGRHHSGDPQQPPEQCGAGQDAVLPTRVRRGDPALCFAAAGRIRRHRAHPQGGGEHRLSGRAGAGCSPNTWRRGSRCSHS